MENKDINDLSKILLRNHQRMAFIANRIFTCNIHNESPFGRDNQTSVHQDVMIWIYSVRGKKNEDGSTFDVNMGYLSKNMLPRYSASTVSRAVETLVSGGFMERYFLNGNRKTTYVRPTQKGVDLVEETKRLTSDWIAKSLSKIFDSEMSEKLLKIQTEYVNLLEDWYAKDDELD